MSGSVKNSVLSKCVIGELDVTDSILVNVTCKKLTGKGLVLYNVCEPEKELILKDGEVLTHVFMDGGKEKLELGCTTETNGGTEWDNKLDGNTKSYADVHKDNQAVDVTVAEKEKDEQHAAAALRVSMHVADAAPAEAPAEAAVAETATQE